MKSMYFAIAFCISVHTFADWKVPAKPDPDAILNEAHSDTQAGRYKDALAKYLWFHQHVLEIDRSYSGVRLSFALDDWYKLGKRYPPAMEKLKQIRNEAEDRVRQGKANVQDAFLDVYKINRTLGDEDRTVAQFVKLDKQAPKTAREVYDIAQPALVSAKKTTLCGKYLQPENSYAKLVHERQSLIKSAERAESAEDKRFRYELADESFIDEAATLTALLVLNDRKHDAEGIAEQVKIESKYPTREAMLKAALEGKLPKRKERQ